MLLMFCGSLLVMHLSIIAGPPLLATDWLFLVPFLGVAVSITYLLTSAVAFNPLRHAFTGLAHLGFHTRPERFGTNTIDSALKEIQLDSAKLGVETPLDFSWKQLLEFDACVQCGRCQVACPAFAAGQPLNPKKLIQDLVVGFSNNKSDRNYRGQPHPGGPATQSKSCRNASITPNLIKTETFWSCTTCRACVYECPMFVEHVDSIIDVRRFLVLEKGEMPGKVPEVIENLRMTANSHGLDAKSRFNWATDLDYAHII